jgi:hypothetical protein
VPVERVAQSPGVFPLVTHSVNGPKSGPSSVVHCVFEACASVAKVVISMNPDPNAPIIRGRMTNCVICTKRCDILNHLSFLKFSTRK